MTAQKIIEKAVAKLYEGSEDAYVTVFKGYEMGTGQNGWHYVPFENNAIYLGKSKSEALEMIEEVADYRELVKSGIG